MSLTFRRSGENWKSPPSKINGESISGIDAGGKEAYTGGDVPTGDGDESTEDAESPA